MPLLASSLRKRLALGLASGMVFVGATGTSFWASSSGKTRLETRQATEVGRLEESSSAGLDQANHSTWGEEEARTGTLRFPERAQAIGRPDSVPAQDRRVILPRVGTMIGKAATNRPYSQL